MPRKSKEWDDGVRTSVLALWASGESIINVINQFGMPRATFDSIRKKAESRGWRKGDPVLLEYVSNAPRLGRIEKIIGDLEEKIIEIFTKNSTTRAYSTAQIATVVEHSFQETGFSVSRRTILRFLKRKRYKNCKRTTKPGLNNLQKKERLRWALRYKAWTIENWKHIVWSDETSVCLGEARGRRRVWRLTKEAYHQHVIRRRWKGRQEFMFWACFTWASRGPCYIWPLESAQMKKKYAGIIKRYNTAHEAEDRARWEAAEVIRREGLRRKPKKPRKWVYTAQRGAMARGNKKGGIDWV